MGQYYRPCLLTPNYKETKEPVIGSVDCYILDNGAKLMEHSYVGNLFVIAASHMLIGNKTNPFVWAGDYADPVNEELHEERNMYYFAIEDDFDKEYTKKHFADLIELDNSCDNYTNEEWHSFLVKLIQPYVINHSKKEYIKVPERKINEFTINPLPLLTASSNGRGGGDYQGTNMEYVGIWAYDIIECGDEVPEGYKELKVTFTEDI